MPEIRFHSGLNEYSNKQEYIQNILTYIGAAVTQQNKQQIERLLNKILIIKQEIWHDWHD